VIETRDLSKHYDTGGPEPRRALDGISLRFQRGQWCSILGANGSGKSTLLRLLAGEVRPTSGDILVDGKSITRQSAARRSRTFFFVEQDARANLVSSMTIEENLILAECRSWLPGLGPARRSSRRRHISEAVGRLNMGLENRLSTQVRALSGGERQAVVLAEALMTKAPVLLLDEFLAAMDPRTGPLLLSATRRVAEERGLTVLSVTHNLDHVLEKSRSDDRIVILREGRVIRDLLAGEMSSTEWLVAQLGGIAGPAASAEYCEENPRTCPTHPCQPPR